MVLSVIYAFCHPWVYFFAMFLSFCTCSVLLILKIKQFKLGSVIEIRTFYNPMEGIMPNLTIESLSCSLFISYIQHYTKCTLGTKRKKVLISALGIAETNSVIYVIVLYIAENVYFGKSLTEAKCLIPSHRNIQINNQRQYFKRGS